MGSNYKSLEGSSMASSGSSSDSLNGLKFGQKIYFEDVGGVGVTATKSAVKKSCNNTNNGNKNGVHNNNNGSNSGHAPRCQVEGCKVDLSDAKAYYSRHKVCGMHSKSPVVIVAGLEQRFCQQCSRFHQLPEFDQGKRSCRRRLAGHNERRRKPPPGSLLSSRLGSLSSSLFGDSTSRSGGFLLDFSAYSRNSVKDAWPTSKTSDGMSGSQSTSAGFHQNMWPGNHEHQPSGMYLQGSAGRSGLTFPSGECITGVSSDSTCALSLLSNETWGSNNVTAGTDLSNLMNIEGASMPQCTATQSVTVAHSSTSNSLWNFKGNEASMGLNVAPCNHLGLGQISQPLNGQFQNDLFMDQAHGGRQYMEGDHSRGYSSAANHVLWSL